MKTIYLIRHAESEANVAMDLDNPTYYYDAKITKRGESQAANARENLKNMTFDKYICSPLTRTLQTFSIIFPEKFNFLIKPLFLFFEEPLKYIKLSFTKYVLNPNNQDGPP